MVVYTDITERREQEERLHALIDGSPVAIVEFDLDAHVRLWNPAAERIFGWSPAEILGQRLPMVPSRSSPKSDELRRRVHAGETYTDYETVRLRKDGTLVDVSIAAAPVRDGYGRAVSNIAVYADITERKAQQAELHRLNAELHARLEELAASRARIVAAGDVERKRLERNLHDGAQQRLVTLALSLRLALASTRTRRPSASRSSGRGRSSGSRWMSSASCPRHPSRGAQRSGLRAAVEGLAARAPFRSRSRTSPPSGCRSPSAARTT